MWGKLVACDKSLLLSLKDELFFVLGKVRGLVQRYPARGLKGVWY